MKIRLRKKINECDGMNTPMNTMGVGNAIIGDVNGQVGSGDLWSGKKYKKIKIRRKKVVK